MGNWWQQSGLQRHGPRSNRYPPIISPHNLRSKSNLSLMSSILDSFKLNGKTAIVTGAARGLGQGMALALAEAGADIVAVDILPAEDTAKQVAALGRKCATIAANLGDRKAID